MNYQKTYDALIERARRRDLGGYVERHHIVPRCLGGGNECANIVSLTPEEHYVAHQLLVKLNPGNNDLRMAVYFMTVATDRVVRNNRLYGWVRRLYSLARRDYYSDPKIRAALSATLRASDKVAAAAAARVGVPRTERVRKKVSASHKTSEAAKKARAALNERKRGVSRSLEDRAKMSEGRSGMRLSETHKQAISASLMGRTKSSEHIAKIAAALTGKPGTRRGAVTSEETRRKQSAAATGRKYSPETIAKMVNGKTAEQRRAAALKAWETKRAKASQLV